MDIAELLRERGGVRLDIGCGPLKNKGFIGMDIYQYGDVDIIHDWNVHPWPLPDECAFAITASHVLEHVPGCVIDNGRTRFPFIEWMDDAWRVLKVGHEMAVAVPYGYSQAYMQDPTHCNPINEARWAYFDPLEPRSQGSLWAQYKPKPWHVKDILYEELTAYMEVILVKRHLTDWKQEPHYYE